MSTIISINQIITTFDLANAYSEQNDPELQKEGFLRQKQMQEGGGKDHEIMQNDDHYLEAMEHGMPPTGGCGIGIDRLCMMLFGQTSIKEVLLFPMFRSSALGKK